ncbi:cerebral cavernous malformations protein 2 homolog [Branchiostoma floridae]|uniref:Cerebral cavernous malformations protein 2 homolog n=1 Tax=Branchiostoma floridae TaxID=7739 RepID=A0A9J7KF72_BRAFL|nr:cerebral cavernous malformations protein 2 homolog [Branchiostoma floridae]
MSTAVEITEMEDDGRKKKSSGFVSPIRKMFSKSERGSDKKPSIVRHRRPLHAVALEPPEYLIDPELLIEDYIEKEVKYLGAIPNVPQGLDLTNRTEVLRIVDDGKRRGLLPWTLHLEHDAIMSLSANHVKLLRRDGEDLLHRVPVHDIAAVCYVRDDGLNLLALKIGSEGADSEVCNIVVLHAESRAASEELCSLIGQTFQLVYTESTMAFLDRSILQGASTPRYGMSLRSTTSSPARPSVAEVFASTPPRPSNNNHSPTREARSTPQHTRKESVAKSESDISITPSAQELLQDYMSLLKTRLKTEELKQFALLLRQYRTSISVREFCIRLKDLYREERKFLMAGMRPFIPEKDSQYFESFLESIGVDGNGILTDSYRRYRRTISDASASTFSANGANGNGNGNGNGRDSVSIPSSGGDATPVPQETEELDRMLSDIHNDIEALATSVENINMQF